METKKALSMVVAVLLAVGSILPAFAADPLTAAKRDLQKISPLRHRYLFSTLGGAAIGAGVGRLLGGGGDIAKGILVGGGGASTAWLYTHPHDQGPYRGVEYLASHTALGAGIGWTVCACGNGALAGTLVGFGASAIWQASQPSGHQTAQVSRQAEETRARLIQQLDQVMHTRDTAEGVIASMPDVSFDSNQSTLTTEARDRLAKFSGVLLAYPDLHLRIEGFTDNTGSPEYNSVLSHRRAETVRNFLITQGVRSERISAVGYGAEEPVASNDTPEGRERNRRVDLVLSGAAIGNERVPKALLATSGGATGTAAGTHGTQQPPPQTPGTVAAPPQH
jgi:outer membrane protein OmpA-like peptidoglycan-associated protein